MKLNNLFKKKTSVAAPVAHKAVGITCAEYHRMHDELDAAYVAACDRQKSCDSKPSGYMKGLKAALEIVDKFSPHPMEVQ
jgi:hypothetical protein